MADDLGARLLRAGLVTRAQLASARGEAPPHEGALVARLVAEGVSERGLAGFFVSIGLGPLLGPDELEGAQPEALATIPPRMAVALEALPVRLGPSGLVVALAAPTDRHAIAELSRASGHPVLPTVACVGDLRAALRATYPDQPSSGVEAASEADEPPVLELVRVRRAGQKDAFGLDGYLGSTRGAERVEARHVVGPQLSVDEEEVFVPLVRTKPVPSPARGIRRAITKNFERPALGPAREVVPVGGAPEGTWSRGAGPRAVVPPPIPGDAASSPRLPPSRVPSDGPRGGSTDPTRSESPKRSIIPPEHERWDLPPDTKIDGSRLKSVAPSPPGRASRPASIGATLSAIRATKDRDEVVLLACRGVLTVARAAVLLALRKSVLKGWDGAGLGLSRDAVRNLWIPSSSPSLFRDVVARGQPYHGPHGTTAADGLFRAALGSRGGQLVLQPVSVAGKLVAVLAADDLRFGADGVERVEVLSQAVGEAFERIIVERRR